MTNIMGIDPGFGNVGWVIAEVTLEPESDPGFKIFRAGVIQTQKTKRDVFSADDNFFRCRSIHRQLDTIFENHRPAVVCMESMSYPRNSSVASKIGMTWGIIASVCEMYGVPVVMNSPQRIRESVLGEKKKVEWEEVAAKVLFLYPELQSLLDHYAKGYHEHMIDAAAAIVGCRDSDMVRMVVNMVGGLKAAENVIRKISEKKS